jgi:hypothetical protein
VPLLASTPITAATGASGPSAASPSCSTRTETGTPALTGGGFCIGLSGAPAEQARRATRPCRDGR